MEEEVKSKDNLTIKEYAEKSGCTVQAVYQRLEKDLKPYLKIENGKKRLDIKALETIRNENNSSTLTSDFKEILKLLENQMAEKDRQLAEKDIQLTEKDRQIEKLENMLDNQQRLQAGVQQTVLQLTDGKHKGLFSWIGRKKS